MIRRSQPERIVPSYAHTFGRRWGEGDEANDRSLGGHVAGGVPGGGAGPGRLRLVGTNLAAAFAGSVKVG